MLQSNNSIETSILLAEELRKADSNKEIVYIILTGEGDFYSSGGDFGDAFGQEFPAASIDSFQELVDALIENSKILIAFVNGPAIGIAFTTLALFDYVIASDKAYFMCPFTEIGLVPEGTSSVTFLEIFGNMRANELLLFGAKLNAAEALKYGFINYVITAPTPMKFRSEAFEVFTKLTEKFPPHSVLSTKALIMNPRRKQYLKKINFAEFAVMRRIWKTDETQNRIAARFFKSKI